MEKDKNLSASNLIESLDDLSKRSDIIKIYANGFQCGASIADASIVVRYNNQSVAIVSMSLPALKSLNEKISEIIENVNKNVGEILSFDEINENIAKIKNG